MDTAIAVIIIAVAAIFVFRKIRKQLSAKGGCGCSGGCSTDSSSGSCCGSGDDSCSCDK